MKLDKDKLEIVRAKKRLTISELAKVYGVSRQRMHMILGQREVTALVAMRLAEALGCDVTEIIEG